MNILCTVRQPHSICFASQLCLICSQRCTYGLETRLCHCCQ
jgi:hypothetical protein